MYMDKINNISFREISNIASIKFKRTEDSISKSLSMMLKDDYNGKDLTAYNEMLNKIEFVKNDYKNINGHNILNIECVKSNYGKAILLNGKLVPVNDKNLPFFSYLAKLTKKIEAMNNNMIVDKDYVSQRADNVLIYGENLSKLIPNSAGSEKRNQSFFDKELIKETANEFNNFLQAIMNNYFGVK